MNSFFIFSRPKLKTNGHFTPFMQTRGSSFDSGDVPANNGFLNNNINNNSNKNVNNDDFAIYR